MTQNDQSAKKATVLIVEDHMAMRKIIKTVLYSLGVRDVVESANGIEALTILDERNKQGARTQILAGQQDEKKAVTLIISDWIMPKMNGYELLQNIRNDTALKDLPFVMLTAEDTKEQIIKALELGISDYIVKPFKAAVLESKLRAILGMR